MHVLIGVVLPALPSRLHRRISVRIMPAFARMPSSVRAGVATMASANGNHSFISRS